MNHPTANDDAYEDEPLGPSMAYPPLYLLRTVAYCPECGQAMFVYTLGCSAYGDAEDAGDDPIDEFHFLRVTRSVPPQVLRTLKAKCPGYYLDRTQPEERPYLMNHCQCGAKLDDDYLHGDVGAAFWPDTPEGYLTLKLHRLRIDEPIPVESLWTLGGGEYLDFGKARRW